MKVVYKGNTIDLDNKQSLGSGGEANVIKYPPLKLAFKIYHQPSKERSDKLRDFISKVNHLPDNVAFPLDVVTDRKNKIVGFAMKIAKKAIEIKKLSNKVYKRKEDIQIVQTIDFFIHSKGTMNVAHDDGFVIGDNNDLNQLFNLKFQSIYIDVDSWQFGKWPCQVGTDEFIDPTLYGIDLTKKPYFTKETDYYSSAVLLFKSLLCVHPFGGVHKQINSLIERVNKKITVLDKDVIYPKIGLNPDILPDSLLEIFDGIFKRGKRNDITIQQLEDLKDKMTKCKKCGKYYSSTRQKCPLCQKVTRQQVADLSQIITKKTVDKGGCIIDDIFTSQGTILFVKPDGNNVAIVNYENGETTFYYDRGHGRNTVKLWDGHIRGMKYDYFQDHLIVSDGKDLMIFRIELGKRVPLSKTTTFSFKNEPIFACSENYLYRMNDKSIVKMSFLHGNLIDEEVDSCIENQTWFKMGSNDLGLGFFKIFEKYQFFAFSPKGRYEIDLPDLPGQLIDIDAQFSVTSLILLRRNIDKGRTYSHVHIINDKGEVLETRSEESLNSELLKNIYGKALAGSHIIHPTDAGVVIEYHGDLSLKSTTSEFISSDNIIFLYKKGLLIVSENKVCYLQLK